jgi:dipeptidase D
MKAFKLSVSGLKGGHSGLDINLGRGNANKILFRFLKHAQKEHRLRIAFVDGGSLRNAIPREAWAIVLVPENHSEKLGKCLDYMAGVYKKELSVTEPNFSFTCAPAELPLSVIDKDTQYMLINAIYACPNGVIRLSDAMPGLVETSTNLASVKMKDGKIVISCLLRSSVDSSKDDLADMMGSVFELAGAECKFVGGYPGWKPNPDSAILTTMQGVYQAHFGKIPEIKAIHAGLECGILGGAYPHWDMISFGPTMRFPHSPDEKVHIESVGKFWKFLVETLKAAPVK